MRERGLTTRTASPAIACEVSCIDWYGNSRPIFTDGRIFALTGTELIEGRIFDGRDPRGAAAQHRPAGADGADRQPLSAARRSDVGVDAGEVPRLLLLGEERAEEGVARQRREVVAAEPAARGGGAVIVVHIAAEISGIVGVDRGAQAGAQHRVDRMRVHVGRRRRA